MRFTAVVVALLFAACSSAPKDPVVQLEDPSTCNQCHAQHYTQWSGSMHAYASDDPVFLAMNKRGQRETSNQLGTFCVQCHAPMAVALGLVTADNAADFDPTTLPPQARGITCYFCHNVKEVDADHNNGLVLALDDTMRGGVHDPTNSPAHNSTYDKQMDSYTNGSVACGSCHDVITPPPPSVPLERTYTEWQATLFATINPVAELPLTCSACHMQTDPTTSVIAAAPGLDVKGDRDFHEHYFAAVDQATTMFPAMSDQTTQLHAILDPALAIVGLTPPGNLPPPGGICLDPPGILSVRMDTISLGHMYPSGAAQDRRVWLEVIAYDAGNNVLFSSGVVPDNMDPEDIGDPSIDCSSPSPNTCSGFWDRTFKADGTTPAHFFWDVMTETTTHALKPQVTNDRNDPRFDHSTTASFQVGGLITTIDHITARIRTRPFSYAMLNDLVQSGDLDPNIGAIITTVDDPDATESWSVATKGTASAINTNCNPYTPPVPPT